MRSKILMTLAFTLGASAAFAMSDTERDAAYTALADEYHAQAVYLATMEKFGQVSPFVSIQKAEAGHIAALTEALEAAGVPVPADPYATGAEPAPELPATLQEVCAIGVEAEIANAALYDDELLPQVRGNATLTRVFTNLRNASADHHLPAFEACAN